MIGIRANNNLSENIGHAHYTYMINDKMEIIEGDCRSRPKLIDTEIQSKAFHIIQTQIMPIRMAFILINEDNRAFMASSMKWKNNCDITHAFFTKVRSLIEDKESTVPLFYKSSELNNIKTMGEEDYCKQAAGEVIDASKYHFVNLYDTCNQVIKETNMKHVILILELHRGQDYVITSNTLEKEDAIAISKAKIINERYTILPKEANYKERMEKEIQVFEIPKREYPLSYEQKLWYINNPSKNPRQHYFAGMLEKIEEEGSCFRHNISKIRLDYEKSNAQIYQYLSPAEYLKSFVDITIADHEKAMSDIEVITHKLKEYMEGKWKNT